MNEYEACSFSQLHNIFCKYKNDKIWMFRGHRDVSWALVPNAGRSKFFAKNEQLFFEAWKRRAVEYMRTTPPNNWEWLAVAQHHRFSTRLLDWSANPLVACFFAVEDNGKFEKHQKDAVVYALHPSHMYRDVSQLDPFTIETGISEYRPSAFAARISRQDARFTIHSPSNLDILKIQDQICLEKIIIKSSYINNLKRELDLYGYNYATLFPDLDGLSQYLNWIASQKDLGDTLIAEENIEKAAEIGLRAKADISIKGVSV